MSETKLETECDDECLQLVCRHVDEEYYGICELCPCYDACVPEERSDANTQLD